MSDPIIYAPCGYGGEDACFDGQSHIFVAGDGENAIAMCDGRPLGTVADIERALAIAEAYDKAERVKKQWGSKDGSDGS